MDKKQGDDQGGVVPKGLSVHLVREILKHMGPDRLREMWDDCLGEVFGDDFYVNYVIVTDDYNDHHINIYCYTYVEREEIQKYKDVLKDVIDEAEKFCGMEICVHIGYSGDIIGSESW